MLDMADNLVADQLAGKRAFGVADAILRQLLPLNAATAPSPDMPGRSAGRLRGKYCRIAKFERNA
jgi:Rod binding domain-containing protein